MELTSAESVLKRDGLIKERVVPAGVLSFFQLQIPGTARALESASAIVDGRPIHARDVVTIRGRANNLFFVGRVERAYKLISATGTQFVFLLNVMSQSRPAGSGWQEFPSNHQVVDSSNIISDCQEFVPLSEVVIFLGELVVRVGSSSKVVAPRLQGGVYVYGCPSLRPQEQITLQCQIR